MFSGPMNLLSLTEIPPFLAGDPDRLRIIDSPRALSVLVLPVHVALWSTSKREDGNIRRQS